MSKVLLALLAQSDSTVQLDAMIAPFEQEGYHVHAFGDQGDLEITSLEGIVQYIGNYEQEPIERLVFISDIKELVFAWYRCYNHLADDFIYCISESVASSSWTMSTAFDDFTRRLASFDGAAEETLAGKIYVNLDPGNYKYISAFLLANNRFQYFKPFEDFEFTQGPQKMNLQKSYQFRQKSYTFTDESATPHENVSLQILKDELLISGNAPLFTEHYYFIPYASFILLEWESLTVNETKFYISTILNCAVDLPLKVKTSLYEILTQLMPLQPLNDEMELLFLYNFSYYKLEANTVEPVLQKLQTSAIHAQYQFPVLMSVIAGLKEEDARKYPRLYTDYQNIMGYMVSSFQDEAPVKSMAYIPNTRRIAFLISQLLSSLHSPTLFIMNYAKKLKQFYPDYEIRIFVSDAFVYPPSELLYNRYFSSEPSVKVKALHDELLKNTGISVHYSKTHLPRVKRLQDEIEAVHSFNPELIFDVDGYNLAKEFLFADYPVLELTLGSLSRSSKADLYISARDASDTYEQYGKHGLSSRKYYQHTLGIDFPDAQKTISRSDYSLKDDHFVMVTVGNRLMAEIDEAFINLIVSFMEGKPQVKWLIVGLAQLPLLSDKHPDLVKSSVIFIPFERDLAALYRICSAYLNPFRTGGGFSAGMAMKQSLPILAMAEKSDVEVYVGSDRCAKSLDEYSEELNHLYCDPAYVKATGAAMRIRIEEAFGFKPAIDELLHFFELAKNEFQLRKSLS